MAKVTLAFAALLVGLGLAGYYLPEKHSFTALIPAIFGLIFALFGALSLSPDASKRKLFMHINVTVALIGTIATFGEIIRSIFAAHAKGTVADPVAMDFKFGLAFLLLIYMLLCVRSFIAARKARLV